MHSSLSDSQAATVSREEIQLAGELALERYTAARRHYTSLYVELNSLEHPGSELAEALNAARNASLEQAAALRRVEDGDPEAVRQELAAEPLSENERARTTSRFSIAELHRAATATPPTWDWKR